MNGRKQYEKKIIAVLLTLALLAGILPTGILATDTVASGTCGENLTWVLDSDGVLTISGTGPMTDWEDYKYNQPWHSYRDSIKAVVIEDGVTTIGNNMLAGPSGSSTEYRYIYVTKVSIANSVTSIGRYAFSYCTALNEIEIPESVTQIGELAFTGTKALKKLVIPDSVVKIEHGAFSDSGIKEITLSQNITELAERLFSGDYSLEDVVIPSSVTSIGNYAFGSCNNLTNIIIPDSITIIGDYTFVSSGLNSIDIPNSVASIGAGAFYLCSSLAEVIIHDGTNIGEHAFAGCTSLTGFDISTTNPCYCSIDGVLFSKDQTTLYCYPAGKTDTVYEILGTTTKVESYAFFDCEGLTSITIQDGVQSIGSQAFYGCSNLTTITLPRSITEIGWHVFGGGSHGSCFGLTDVYYGGSEEDWANISIDSYNEYLTGATIHYNSTGPDDDTGNTSGSEDSLINSSTFYMSSYDALKVGGGTTFGESNCIYVLMRELEEGNIQNEAASVVWTIDDTSIAELSASYVAESSTAGFYLEVTAYKPGEVTITGTAADGRIAQATIPVEPELIAGTSNTITEETEITLCSVSLEEANAEYLESFMSQLEVDVDYGDIGALSVSDSYYEIAEDGLSAKLVYVLKPIYAGEITLTVTSAGGQLAELVVHSGLEIYPGAAFSLVDDVWSFANSTAAFGTDRSEGYYITRDDYDTLLSNLSNVEKVKFSTSTTPVTYRDTIEKTVEVVQPLSYYNVDGEIEYCEKWVGSCYGMSAWVCLAESGVLHASDIDNTTSTLNSYTCTKDVESAINYYFWQQKLKAVNNATNDFMSLAQIAQLSYLEDLAKNASNGGNLIFICYEWYEDFNNDGTCNTESGVGHAVVGYGHETGDYTEFVRTYMGDRIQDVEFTHCILIYDCAKPNGGDSYNIYYSDDGIWCIPGRGIISTASDIDVTYDLYNNGDLTLVTADTELINAIDYNTGTVSKLVEEASTSNYNFLTSLQNCGFTVAGDTFSAYIDGFNTFNNTADNQIHVILSSRITTEGDASETIRTVALPKSESYTVNTTDMSAYQLESDNYLTSAVSTVGGTITFQPDGGASIETDEAALSYISITANEGYYSLPWYTIEVSSSDSSNISVELIDDGILISGDLNNVTVYATNDEETVELTFSSDDSSMLITDSGDELMAIPEHCWDEGVLTKAPTLTQEGIITYTCTACGEKKTETLAKLTVCDGGEDCPSNVYKDAETVQAGWWHLHVDFVTETGLMQGYDTGYFEPLGVLTRAEMVQIIYNWAGKPAVSGSSAYTDVANNVWYAPAVIWATQQGVVEGYGDGTFGPEDYVTREQLAAMLYRFAGEPATAGSLSAFTDASTASAYAVNALKWAVEVGILQGNGDGTLNPTGYAKRAEIAAMLQRYIEG